MLTMKGASDVISKALTLALLTLVLLVLSPTSRAQTNYVVNVGPIGEFRFDPEYLIGVNVGDTITWNL
jgi:plastocyanin